MTMVVAITSRKAGVGKSLLGANLSKYLNQKGHRTGLIAAGARKPLWGIEPDNHWPGILGGRLPLDQAIHRDVFGIDMMVMQDCGRPLQELCAGNGDCLDDALDMLDDYAYLIVEYAAEISPPALACCLAATATLLILTPDPATLTATYEWLSQLSRHGFQGPVRIVFGQVGNPTQARSIYLRFRNQVQNRLRLHTSFWGALTKEPAMDSTVVSRYPLLQAMPQSPLLRNIHAIGDRLVAEQPPENQGKPLKDFWRRFHHYLRQMPDVPAPPERKMPSATENQPAMKDLRRPSTDDAQALAWLNTQLTNIAHDLQAIRRLLEAGYTPGTPPGRNGKENPSQKVILDFDAFYGRQQKPEEQ
jgi:flagellar biosynthesis protein FlhG